MLVADSKKNDLHTAYVILAGAVLVSVLLILGSGVRQLLAYREHRNLTKRINDLSYVQETYDDYARVQAEEQVYEKLYDHNSDSNYTVVADQNKVITLYYQPVTGLSYSVNYLEQGSNRVLHNAKTVDGVTHGRTYSESAVSIPGYKLVGSASRSVTVSDGGDNVITFYYEKDAAQTQDVSYEVRYTVAGVLRSEETVTVTDHIWVNDTAEIAIVDGGIPAPADKYPGYVLDSENPVYPAAGTKVASGTVFTVNYVPRTDLSYTVRYLEQGTNKVLHEEKTVQNQTFGATVTEEPVQITGYVTPSEQELTIGLENNVITFYYQRDNGQTKSLSYTVQYYKDGQLQENDTLRFTANVWDNAPDKIGRASCRERV